MKRFLVMVVLVQLVVGCGGDDNNDATNNGGANNDAMNNGGTNSNKGSSDNSASNAGEGPEGWTMTFEGGEKLFDFPDVEGAVLGGSKCVGGSTTLPVTFTNVEPVQGSFAGMFPCHDSEEGPDSSVDVTVSGEFGQTL